MLLSMLLMPLSHMLMGCFHLHVGSRCFVFTSRLTSKFYTVIPHSFGRRVPPVLDTQTKVQVKREMLLVSPPDSYTHRLTDWDSEKII